MSEMLKIDTVDVVSWGRASGVELTLPDSGLVVLYGPNESGKTSLATALAWLVAGPGTPQLTRRFGNEGDRLKARLQGRLRDERLTADVNVKVAGRSSRAVGGDFHASIDGAAVGRADLTSRLGGIDFDSYQRFHWVEALKVADGSNLQENVTVQAVFGGVNPFAEAAALASEAKDCLGASRGRAKSGTARELHSQVTDLDRRMQKMLGARKEWARLEEEIERATADRDEYESRLVKSKGDLRSVQLAVKAHGNGAVAARDEAARALAGTPVPSDAERDLHRQTTLASRRIGELQARESDVASAQQQWAAAIDDVDPVWRPIDRRRRTRRPRTRHRRERREPAERRHVACRRGPGCQAQRRRACTGGREGPGPTDRRLETACS